MPSAAYAETVPWLAQLDQPLSGGLDHCLQTRVTLQLLQQVLNVITNGCRADVDLVGDVAGVFATGKGSENVRLLACEVPRRIR